MRISYPTGMTVATQSCKQSIAPITLPSGDIAQLYLRVPLPDLTTTPLPTLPNNDASDILWSNIWQWDTYSLDGLERIHLGQLEEILTPSPLSCMAMFYPSITTRHDVESCYCCPVSPQTFRTVPTGLLQIPPTPQHQLPYRSPVASYTREISRFGNGKLCPGVPCIKTVLFSV
jgi:hypothetical protein